MTITVMAMTKAITKVTTIKMMMMIITRLVQIINVMKVKVDVPPINVVVNMDGVVDRKSIVSSIQDVIPNLVNVMPLPPLKFQMMVEDDSSYGHCPNSNCFSSLGWCVVPTMNIVPSIKVINLILVNVPIMLIL